MPGGRVTRPARRRRKGIPTDRHLTVVACMDERIPVEEALGLEAAAGGRRGGARPGSAGSGRAREVPEPTYGGEIRLVE